MNFLLQTVNGLIQHDFVLECLHSIEYLNWKETDSAEFRLCELNDITSGNISDVEEYIPVGTIEFVFAFIDKFVKPDGSLKIKPLNVPERLFHYVGRKIENVSGDKLSELLSERFSDCKKVFIKSNDLIKAGINGIYSVDDILNSTSQLFDNKTEYQVSEMIDIISEWRCFVYNDKLYGVQYYSGDFGVYPDVSRINEIICDYKWNFGSGDAPQAYTIDVAVNGNGETVVIEVHEFFSCGLYGFSDLSVLPYMFKRTFDNIRKRL